MPRRPKSSSKNSKRPRPLKRSDASIEKWNAFLDIPLDEEDEFHASRDRIPLEGKDAGEDLEEDDEVFALKGLDQDESEEESEDEQSYEDEVEEAEVPKAKSLKSKTKTKKTEYSASSSEESQEEEEEESWGRKTSTYYSSNAAQIESDDEEALELEENEALRLQAKTRDGMEDNDFGLNDTKEANSMETDYLTEPAPVVLPSLPNDKKSILRHLEKSNPEALALAGDWDDSTHNLFKTRAKLDKLQSEDPDSLSLGMIHLYYQTLLTYTTTLAFYLHLRAHEKYAQRPESLRTHPIMERLLTLKQSLATLEDLDFAPADSDEENDVDEEEDVNMSFDFQPKERLMRRLAYGGLEPLEPFELSELLKDAFTYQEGSLNAPQADDIPKPPKKKRKTSKEPSKPSQPIFDLVEPEFTSTKISSNPLAKDMASDVFGEALSLQHADAVDKNARRKSLRFHTAKIESASARRQGARQALGGDDDIPYRERRRESEARLLKETKGRIRNQGGDDLDATEPKPRPSNQMEGGASEDEADLDGYYNLVKKTSKLNKEKKKADYEAEKAASRLRVDEESADGPRSLTKAILNNRGLTPRRPKSARNPRVKKREKYDKAKKRVASQKAVYKGGLSETGGRYEGEKSGISKVVKSVRLA